MVPGWYGGCSRCAAAAAVPVQGLVVVSRAGSGGWARAVTTAAVAAAAGGRSQSIRRERCAAGRAAGAKSSTGIAAATKTPVGVQQAPPAEWGLQRKRMTGPGSLAHNWRRRTWRTLFWRWIRDPEIKKKKIKTNGTASAQKQPAACEARFMIGRAPGSWWWGAEPCFRVDQTHNHKGRRAGGLERGGLGWLGLAGFGWVGARRVRIAWSSGLGVSTAIKVAARGCRQRLKGKRGKGGHNGGVALDVGQGEQAVSQALSKWHRNDARSITA